MASLGWGRGVGGLALGVGDWGVGGLGMRVRCTGLGVDWGRVVGLQVLD